MMETIKISIIVPVYNVEKYLKRCIESIINQTYKNLEIILVDDGSTDNCPAICDEYARKDKRIKVIHKENGGASSSRNTGMDAATGKYITFVDSDDFIKEEFVEYLYNLSIENNCEIVQCSFEIGSNEKFSDIRIRDKVEVYSNIEALCSRKLKVVPWGKLYKMKTIKSIKFPLGIINEDDATYYKFIYNSKRVCITNKQLYYYYQSNNSVMRNNSKYKRTDFINIYKDRIKFFKEKKEVILYEKSYERFCLVLMLFYISCKKDKENTNDKKEILNLYRENLKTVLKSKYTSIKFKLMFIIFNLTPNSCSFIINKLKLR